MGTPPAGRIQTKLPVLGPALEEWCWRTKAALTIRKGHPRASPAGRAQANRAGLELDSDGPSRNGLSSEPQLQVGAVGALSLWRRC
jgi:hypothetical protein